MPRNANNFREKNEKVDEGEILTIDTWYRSPLSPYDHMIGEEKEWFQDEIAWCGFSLGYARDMEDTGEAASLGGLWVSDRTRGKCAECKRKKKEWDEARTPYVY